MCLICKRENPVTLRVYPQKTDQSCGFSLYTAAHTQEIQSYYSAHFSHIEDTAKWMSELLSITSKVRAVQNHQTGFLSCKCLISHLQGSTCPSKTISLSHKLHRKHTKKTPWLTMKSSTAESKHGVILTKLLKMHQTRDNKMSLSTHIYFQTGKLLKRPRRIPKLSSETKKSVILMHKFLSLS